MEWRPIDEELYNVPQGTHVFIYYSDEQYDRYDLIVKYENIYYSRDAWKSVINNVKNRKPLLYLIVPLPEIPEEYKPSGGRFDEIGALIPVKDWR